MNDPVSRINRPALLVIGVVLGAVIITILFFSFRPPAVTPPLKMCHKEVVLDNKNYWVCAKIPEWLCSRPPWKEGCPCPDAEDKFVTICPVQPH